MDHIRYRHIRFKTSLQNQPRKLELRQIDDAFMIRDIFYPYPHDTWPIRIHFDNISKTSGLVQCTTRHDTT